MLGSSNLNSSDSASSPTLIVEMSRHCFNIGSLELALSIVRIRACHQPDFAHDTVARVAVASTTTSTFSIAYAGSLTGHTGDRYALLKWLKDVRDISVARRNERPIERFRAGSVHESC